MERSGEEVVRGGATATLYELVALGPKRVVSERLVGSLAPGGRASLMAKAGARFVARDARTRKPLLEYTAGFEAEQHADVAASTVLLELALAPSALMGGGVADVYWLEGERPDGAAVCTRLSAFHADVMEWS